MILAVSTLICCAVTSRLPGHCAVELLMAPQVYGLALDVDGVLVRDAHVIPEAKLALELLRGQDKIVPVFITNGGSITEEEKAVQLSEKLGISVTSEEVILSHTPIRRLARKYADQNVLVIGGQSCMKVARCYGFNNPICPSEYHFTHHSIYPSRLPAECYGAREVTASLSESTGGDLAAIIVLGDSADWGLDMQVMTDALLNNECKGESHIPIYACNADIVYTGRHPSPRYTQGAFMYAFRSLFDHYSKIPIDVEYCGKPFAIQYEYAEETIRSLAMKRGLSSASSFRYFGVGDNPKSDIRGANNAGELWTSILVKTGVFKGEVNDPEDPADFVVENVLEAIQLILEKVSSNE